MTQSQIKNLYEQDFAFWIEDTVSKLKARNTEDLDWENLIEEVESLGISQRKAVHSFLVRLLEHLLKRCYICLPNCFRAWELKKEFKYSPSLKSFMLDILTESYQDTLAAMREDYPDVIFPNVCPFPQDVDALLTQKFWENI
jgi:hypothetical protein